MRTFLAALFLIALAGCSDGGSGVPPGGDGTFSPEGFNGAVNYCNMGTMCLEIHGGDMSFFTQNCWDTSQCSLSDTIGTCTTPAMNTASGTVVEKLYFYDGTFSASQAQSYCNTEGGVFNTH